MNLHRLLELVKLGHMTSKDALFMAKTRINRHPRYTEQQKAALIAEFSRNLEV